jgi:hypothetical protein
VYLLFMPIITALAIEYVGPSGAHRTLAPAW